VTAGLRQLSRRSLRAFLASVVISCQPQPRRFLDAADKWQWEKVLDPLIPAVEAAIGQRDGPLPYDGFCFILHKGADKTSVAGRICSYCVQFAPRRVSIVHAAADRDQAAELRKVMTEEKALNPWFLPGYEIHNYDITGPTGDVEILSSDAKTSHGKRADLIICDELTVWKSRELWDTLNSTSVKRQGCLTLILCNAGYAGTWQDAAIKEFKKSPRWYVYHPSGIVASWINRQKVDEIRKTMLPTEAQRLFDNIFVESLVNAAFPPEAVEQMFLTHNGRPLGGISFEELAA